MKKDIISNPYARALGKVMATISWIAFSGAIILSAFFYNLVAQEFLAERGYTHAALTWGALGGAVLAAAIVGIGIKLLASFLLFDRHAMRTGRARYNNPEVMPTIKRVAFFGLLALLGFEVYAALKGGDISAKLIAPKVEGVTEKVLALEDRKAAALAPLRARVLDIEAQIDDAVAAKTSRGDMPKLLKKNNDWAVGVRDSIQRAETKKHSKALADAKAAYDKEEKRLNETIATATKTDSKVADKQLANAEAAEAFYGAWLKVAALLCIALGLLMENGLAANESAKHVRPLSDAEALAIEAEREAAKRSSFLAGMVGAVRSMGARSGGGRAPDPNNGAQGNAIF